MSPLSVTSFGGGVALLGSADTRRIDELLEGDSVDIGPRGALICTSDLTDYVTLVDDTAAQWSQVYGMISAVPGFNTPQVSVFGAAIGSVPPETGNVVYYGIDIERQGEATPATGGDLFSILVSPNGPFPISPEGVYVTGFTWPGVFSAFGGTDEVKIAFFCLGSREGFAPNSNDGHGLWVNFELSAGGGYNRIQIKGFDALGTGPVGEFSTGTESVQLFFRGVIKYNNHLLGWGFDAQDPTNGDGPCRVMFSNLGLPLKWGNDNQAATGGDRAFTDSDAIVLGSAGEIIRAAIVWAGKCWFFTNQQGHYIAGFGRDSFLTDGATHAVGSYNVVGPYGLIEGPDRKLYGVGDQGLWRTADGANFDPLFLKLRDFTGHSPGYWDLIWVDPTRTAAELPGRTNQDLVWTACDYQREQVLIGIPWCDSETGYGYGEDTVIVKFHVRTGGFTRQVFPGVQLTAPGYFRREGQQPETRFIGTPTSGETTVQRYAFTASQADSPVLPDELPEVTFGYYAPFGPDGDGVVRRAYMTIAWEEPDSLPLVFTITVAVDDSQVDSFRLTIGPTTPVGAVFGDLWLDTSNSDTSIGNTTSTATIASAAGYLLKTLRNGVWELVQGLVASAQRATIPLPLTRRQGTRMTLRWACTTASGRFQFETAALEPGSGSAYIT